MSDSPGLVDFAIGLVNSVFNLPDGRSILLLKKLLGLVKMMSGLVNVSFSLPKWQAVKMIFFAPCIILFLTLSFIICDFPDFAGLLIFCDVAISHN